MCLVFHKTFHTIKNSYAIACGKEKIYTKEDLAKAADYIMKYNVDASFAMGLLDENSIGISGRSNGNINVGNILSLLGGGGHVTSAATRIEGSNLIEVIERLKFILTPGNININDLLKELTYMLQIEEVNNNISINDVSKKLKFVLSGESKIKMSN